ncbi:MAG: polyisoprenoid-binding protein [Deltaproteobacteria bacterium]|jgi:polyisoprenoid-binding protein YceI|nr:MAG: polyisoprenoid-binding protein [Deltaproteobacteria bacterium]
MRRIAIIMVSAFFLALPAAVPAGTWELDTAHSGVHFKVRHLMVSYVRGDFEKISGRIVYDEKDISRSSADITIEAASINTRVAKRDDHLRSPDFLDAAKYPVITFKSKRVEKAGDGRLKMTGDLTIRGVTREVVLDVQGPAPPIKDLEGKTRVGGSATTKIDRKDFGLTWNKAIESGGVVVGDEVEITIDVEVVKDA